MKAQLPKTGFDYSDKVTSHRKENAFWKQLTLLDPKTGRSIINARFYQPGTVCYCCLWVSGGEHYGSGAGRAGGGGYHKPSAALSEALRDAGVTLNDPISGYGDSHMWDALEALGRALTGKRKFFRVEAHA